VHGGVLGGMGVRSWVQSVVGTLGRSQAVAGGSGRGVKQGSWGLQEVAGRAWVGCCCVVGRDTHQELQELRQKDQGDHSLLGTAADGACVVRSCCMDCRRMGHQQLQLGEGKDHSLLGAAAAVGAHVVGCGCDSAESRENFCC
jgi:hypothetical protein